jgi:hypothetical protein
MFHRSLKYFIIFAGCMLISSSAFSQSDTIPVRDDNARLIAVDMTHSFDFGLGFGLDYGGILGIQMGVAPIKHLTFFGAVGYYMFQAGWNFGMKGLLFPKTTQHAVRPFLKAMYGCNSVIAVDGADEYDQVYKGFTVGLGFEFRFGKKKMNGLDLDLNVPLRTGEFWYDYTTMKNDPRLEVTQGPIPIAFSIGYHHEF